MTQQAAAPPLRYRSQAVAGPDSPSYQSFKHGDCQVAIFGQHDQRTIDQLLRCAETAEATAAALCADGHVGYGLCVGGVLATERWIAPAAPGVDLGCGNRASKTNIRLEDIHLPSVMDEIVRRISFGVGRANNEPIDHPVLDHIREAPFEPQRQLLDLAARSLGTCGGGNHYVDLFTDEDGYIWVGVHFGSRGFGYKTAKGFLAMARGLSFGDKVKEPPMDAAPDLIEADSLLGQAYVEAVSLAKEYAYAGRNIVVERVLEILGAESTYTVHNNHNDLWREEHMGHVLWIARKGSTPAFPGQEGFVGATMGENSVILEGTDSPLCEASLHSTVHGAGRAMSRRAAKGKMSKIWVCDARGCDRVIDTPSGDSYSLRGGCPVHPNASPRKVWRLTEPGLINYEIVQKELKEQGIELRGGEADEAPGAYKRLEDVLSSHEGQILIKHRLHPVGVAMAGPGIFDPWKD